ncbi:MAG: AMP-binding protein [Bacteroidales bacterium]|nr:AMP-binding protein [Bacteroidales bacterium]
MISSNDLSKTAIISSNKNISYKELLANINKYSQLFTGKDYKKVAIYSENRVEWIYAFYAAWQNNCVVVPVDFLASPDDVAYILDDCNPELIFIGNDVKEKLEHVQSKINYEPKICDFSNVDLPVVTDKVEEYTLHQDKDETAVIIYTSGTTGNPKGVMLSFTNLLANITAVSKNGDIYLPEREVLMLLPLHHVFPLEGSMMAPLYVGGTIVMSPSMQSSDIIETLKNNKVSIMIGVPRLYELLYKGIKAKIDSSFITKTLYKLITGIGNRSLAKKIFAKVHDGLGGYLKIMVAGGAALDKDVGNFFYSLGFDILEGYGMTEAAPMITFTRPGNIVIGSAGQALPGVTIKIENGEILAKGKSIMKGYYNRPEETAEIIKNGWLYTGDLGNVDEKGFLRITGRIKEIIVLSNGKNINPVELETKLERKVECINEAAVFMYNKMLHAVVFPNYDYFVKNEIENPKKYFEETVFPNFNKDVSSYKRIMKYTLIKSEIPRTRLGKIQRFRLSELIEKSKKKTKVDDYPKTKEFIAVKSFIESQVDMTVCPDDHLEFDIALDSLGKISLIDFIEKTFGVEIEEENLLQFPSIKQMTDYIKEKKIHYNREITDWSDALKEKVSVNLPKTWPTLAVLKSSFKRVFQIYFRLKGKGAENLPDGPCIITPNHQSYFDGLFVMSFLKRKFMNKTYFYAKKKHVNNKFLSFMAKKNNVIVMDLNYDLKESIQKMAEVLRLGNNLIIFPEGTRTETGEVGKFKKTFAILSKELNVPVIPVAINGAYDALPRGSRFPKFLKNINVNFLQAIYPQEYTYDSLQTKVQDVISKNIA